MNKTLVAIHRIQRTVKGQRQAIPPGMVFDVEESDSEDETGGEFYQLTSGDDPAARVAKESDIVLAREAGMEIEVRKRRPKTIREINAIKAAQLYTGPEDQGPGEGGEGGEGGDGKSGSAGEKTDGKGKKPRRVIE